MSNEGYILWTADLSEEQARIAVECISPQYALFAYELSPADHVAVAWSRSQAREILHCLRVTRINSYWQGIIDDLDEFVGDD